MCISMRTLRCGGVNSRESTTCFDHSCGPNCVWWLFVWHHGQSSRGVGGGDRGCSLGNEWTVQMCTTERTIPFSMLQLLSPSMSFWLYQFLVQTVAPRGSEVWSYTVAEGTVTQRPLKISEGQLSVRDQMSGMEWGCKTIYGGLWLLCKHGRDERTENRGGQKSHDSETGGGVRIRKAIMITDQSQTPEAGARQVVYTH